MKLEDSSRFINEQEDGDKRRYEAKNGLRAHRIRWGYQFIWLTVLDNEHYYLCWADLKFRLAVYEKKWT